MNHFNRHLHQFQRPQCNFMRPSFFSRHNSCTSEVKPTHRRGLIGVRQLPLPPLLWVEVYSRSSAGVQADDGGFAIRHGYFQIEKIRIGLHPQFCPCGCFFRNPVEKFHRLRGSVYGKDAFIYTRPANKSVAIQIRPLRYTSDYKSCFNGFIP